jgi:hypothetical protein
MTVLNVLPIILAMLAATTGRHDEFSRLRILQEPRATDFHTKREGHARCVSCHSVGTTMRLEPLSAGKWRVD